MLSKNIIISFIVGFVIAFAVSFVFNNYLNEKPACPPVSIKDLAATSTEGAAIWQNPEKPKQSLPLTDEEIPEQAVRLAMTTDGFSPSSFTVKKGQEVILAVTSQDKWVHVFKFKDKSLAEVVVGVASAETRAITFYAPQRPGQYEFYCAMPTHQGAEKGMMKVE